MRPSGPADRPWARLDAVEISASADCKFEWEDTCIIADRAVRLVWNPKTCAYDDEPWPDAPSAAEFAKVRQEFK